MEQKEKEVKKAFFLEKKNDILKKAGCLQLKKNKIKKKIRGHNANNNPS